jgi:hypothetical protein
MTDYCMPVWPGFLSQYEIFLFRLRKKVQKSKIKYVGNNARMIGETTVGAVYGRKINL